MVKGSGQFIFASVVVGFVGDSTSALSPQERLDLVLEVVEREGLRPLERLDLLYPTVLSQNTASQSCRGPSHPVPDT